jgi:hypothetical protein
MLQPIFSGNYSARDFHAGGNYAALRTAVSASRVEETT